MGIEVDAALEISEQNLILTKGRFRPQADIDQRQNKLSREAASA